MIGGSMPALDANVLVRQAAPYCAHPFARGKMGGPGNLFNSDSAGAAQILAASVHRHSGSVDPDFVIATTKAQQSCQSKKSNPTVIGSVLYWTCLVDSGGLRIIRISGCCGWILLS